MSEEGVEGMNGKGKGGRVQKILSSSVVEGKACQY